MSAKVGMSGSAADLLASATARMRTLPLVCRLKDAPTLPTSESTWPPMRSVSAGVSPLQGTWITEAPVMLANRLAVR